MAVEDREDFRNRKSDRRIWWRRVSALCSRKKKKKKKVPPQGVLQETEGNPRENRKGTKGEGWFYVGAWPLAKRFWTLSDVQQSDRKKKVHREEPSMNFSKTIRNIFNRACKHSSCCVLQEDTEDAKTKEDSPRLSVSPVDEPPQLHVTAATPEVLTVSVEMSVQRAEDPEDERLVCDVRDGEDNWTDRSESVRANSRGLEGQSLPVGGVVASVCPEDDGSSGAAVTRLSQKTCETLGEDESEKTSSAALRPPTNGPSIHIQLVPPDDEEDEERWQDGSSPENHLCLLLLGSQHSELQLLQTARRLVRAAVGAALDQLSREQLSRGDHREAPECRDQGNGEEQAKEPC